MVRRKFFFFLASLGLLVSVVLAACGPLLKEVSPVPAAVSPTASDGFKGVITVGGVFDLSGPTAVEGRDYAAGVISYVNLFNASGGAGGYKIELKARDFAAKAPVAIEQYQQLLKEGAVAFLAWDTADTLALTRQIKKDHVPLLSASYDEELVRDVKRQPYNFMVVPSYSDQIKLALLYARQNRLDPKNPEPVMTGYLYSDDNFGRFPYQVGRDYAAAHGVTWFHEGILQPKIDRANLLHEADRLRIAHPEYTFIQAKPALTAELLKIMRAADVPGLFLGLNDSASPDLPALAGKAAEGFMAFALMAQPDETEPGLTEIRKALANRSALSTATPTSKQALTTRFIQGWVTMKVLAEGIRLAVASNPSGQLNGGKVKEGLERIQQFEMGGLTPPLSFSPTKHKGTDLMRILKVEQGQWKAITPYFSYASLE